MIKIIVSNRIYVKLPKELVRKFEAKYTFNIYTHPGQKYPKTAKQIFRISDDVFQLERGALAYLCTELDKVGTEYEIIDKRISKPVKIPDTIFPPRKDQADVSDSIISTEGGIVNGAPSYGKTFTAIYIASLLQEKTLVVTTTTAIRSNWVSEIKKFLNIDAGIIGDGKITNIESPIVVGNIQSVKKFSSQLSKEFGILVVDEGHHTPADTFTSVVTLSHAKYRIMLSGTLKRKDGLEVVLPGLFGENIVIPPDRNRLKPIILRLPLEGVELSGNQLITWATKINELYANDLYVDTLYAITGLLEAAGHKVLVTADRVKFLEDLAELFGEKAKAFTGNTAIEDRDTILELVKKNKCSIVAGTQSIFSEGVSSEPLSALLMGGSTNNESLVEQTIGRIQRLMEGKLQPIVVDVCLGGSLGKKHSKERKTIYLLKGWKIIECDDLTKLTDAILATTKMTPEST